METRGWQTCHFSVAVIRQIYNDKNNLQKENLLLQSFKHQSLQQTSWKIRIFASKEMDFSDDKHPVSREIRADLTFLIKSEIDGRDVLFFSNHTADGHSSKSMAI